MKNAGLIKALRALDASIDRDVNDVVKKLRMDLSEQIDYYWGLAEKEQDQEQKAVFSKAAEYLRALHQSKTLNERFVS